MSIGPLPFTFNNFHSFDIIFGAYNKLSLYFQLIETTCCLLGLHGNHSHINDVTSGRHIGFSNFIFSYIRIVFGIYKNVRFVVKLSVLVIFLAKIVVNTQVACLVMMTSSSMTSPN